MLQFGKYRGQSFRWMLENALGYVGWFVDNIRNEKVTNSPISQNKAALKKYVESFKEGRDVVALKKKQREDKEGKKQSSSTQPSQSSASNRVVSSLAAGLVSGRISSEKYLSRVASTASAVKFKPTIPVSTRKRKPVTPSATVTSTLSSTQDADDEELSAIADQIERNLGNFSKLRYRFFLKMYSERIFFIFIVVQPTRESNTSQQQTPEASLSIQPPELPQVSELVGVPEPQPEPKQVPTASIAFTSSVRNQGTSFLLSVVNFLFLLY